MTEDDIRELADCELIPLANAVPKEAYVKLKRALRILLAKYDLMCQLRAKVNELTEIAFDMNAVDLDVNYDD